MIKIKDLLIYYRNQCIIENSNISIYPGHITVIRGESGTGKSSLLSFLALEKSFHGTYSFDDILISSLTDGEKEEYKRTKIAFVNQQNSLLSDLTVRENMEFVGLLCGDSLINEKMDQLLEYFQLSHLKNVSVKKLSGGEKQRVAIACSLLKDADLYLFDEPTSMLDIKTKELIVNAINFLAKKGKMILISTHEDETFNFDHGYEIIDKKIYEFKSAVPTKREITSGSKLNLDRVRKYLSEKNIYNHMFFSILMILTISLCMGYAFSEIIKGYGSIKRVNETISDIYSQELYLVNKTSFSLRDFDNSDSFFAIDADEIEAIKSLEHVVSVEPMVYFPIADFVFDKEGNPTQISLEDAMTFTLVQNDTVIKEHVYGSVYIEDLGQNQIATRLAIFPTYPHQKFQSRCSVVEEGEGIYISKKLADTLSLKELDNHYLQFKFTIPIAETRSTITYGDTIQEGRAMFSVLAEESFKIVGILEDTPLNTYTWFYEDEIYLPIDTMKELQDKYHKEYENMINKKAEQKINGRPFFLDTDWQWSSSVIVIDDYNYIDSVIENIESIKDTYRVNKVNYFDGIEIDAEMSSLYKKTTWLYSGSILIAIYIGIVVIKILLGYSRKSNYVYLRINGFTNKEILKTELLESKKLSSFISVLVIIFSYILIQLEMKNVIDIVYPFSWVTMLAITIMSYFIMTSTTILSNTICKKLLFNDRKSEQ